mgnify:CR=1 FL=1
MTARVTLTQAEYVAELERTVGRLTIERNLFGERLDQVTDELEALKAAQETDSKQSGKEAG